MTIVNDDILFIASKDLGTVLKILIKETQDDKILTYHGIIMTQYKSDQFKSINGIISMHESRIMIFNDKYIEIWNTILNQEEILFDITKSYLKSYEPELNMINFQNDSFEFYSFYIRNVKEKGIENGILDIPKLLNN